MSDHGSPDLALERVRSLLELNRAEEAFAMVRDVLSVWPDDTEAHRLASMAANRCERHEDAVEHAKAALILEPDSPSVLRTAALAHLGADRWKEAFDLGDRAVAGDPRSPSGHLLRSMLLVTAATWFRGTNDWYLPDAERSAAEALRLAPMEPEPFVMLGHIAFLRKDLVAAEHRARQALELDPECSDAHQLLGWVADRARNPEAAQEHYRAAGRLDPRDDRPRHLLHGVGRPGVRGYVERLRAPWRK